MNFRGMELEFDILDADQAELFEKARLRVVAGAEETREDEDYAGGIRRLCALVFAFFDDCCGEGTHQKLFGAKVNFRDCFQAFKDFAAAVDADRDEALQQLADTAPKTRAKRRAAARKS